MHSRSKNKQFIHEWRIHSTGSHVKMNVVQDVLTANSRSRGHSEGVNIYCIRWSSAWTACIHWAKKKKLKTEKGARAASSEAAGL